MDIIVANVGAFMELWMIQIYFSLVWKELIVFRKFSVFLFLWNAAAVTLANIKIIPGVCVWTSYLWLWGYGKVHFRAGLKKNFLNFTIVLLCMIVTEIISVFGVRLIFWRFFNEDVLYVLSSTIAVICALTAAFYLRKSGKVFVTGIKYEKIFYICIICFGLVLILITDNYFTNSIRIWYDMFIVLFVILLWFYILKQHKTEMLLEQKKFEDKMKEFYGNIYENVLSDIRRKQHDFKNQLLAIYSSHKTAKSFEELKEIQRKYCDEIINDNNFENILLKCNEPIIAGFLYHKFVYCSGCGVDIDYDIGVDRLTCKLMLFEIIEILGNFMDNACEYVLKMGDKRIKIILKDTGNFLEIMVSNPSEYVTGEKIDKMFMAGYSNKGAGRGLGLSRVKQICDKYKLDIVVYNETTDTNWINFKIIIDN